MSNRASSGRRAAGGPATAAALVLLVLAALAVVLTSPAGAPAADPAAAVPSGRLVTRTQLRCPDRPADAAADGSLRVGLLAGAGLPDGPPAPVRVDPGPALQLARGRLTRLPGAGGETVRGSGPSAVGLFGFRTDRRAGRVLAVTPCLAPGARWWFTGAGAGLDHTSTLVLANLDPGPAVVDLRVLGPDGEVDTVATSGIVVAPGSERRLRLADLAPQTADLAIEVHAERGRVAASVTDAYRARAAGALGSDRVPGGGQPDRTLVLAGLPSTSGRRARQRPDRTLLVANPSELEAVVDVSVSGRSGSFTPTGLRQLTVAPGALATVELTRVVPAAESVAVRLRSPVPVLASVRSVQAGDHAYGGQVAALTGPAVAPLVRDAAATVQLTAGEAPARVRLAAYDGQGARLGGRTMTVAATGTASWSPTARAGYLVVTPVRGTVRGAVSYAGAGLAVVPLQDLPVRELRPRVRPAVR